MSILPSISLSALDEPTSRENELARLSAACRKFGFFYLIDHRIDDETVQSAIESAHGFFALPISIKDEFGHKNQTVVPRSARGYSPIYGETLHPDAGADSKEIFDMGTESDVEDRPFFGRTNLPNDAVAPGFARTHLALQQEVVSHIVPILGQALADLLDLPALWFADNFLEPVVLQRVIRYPPHSGNAGKHTDNGFLTVLIQETIREDSLQVYLNDQWTPIPSIPEAFVINLGDMLQMLSQGEFVSTPHQVVHTSPSDRISLPFFVYPNIDSSLGFQDSQNSITVGDVMLKNFASIWDTGGGAGRARELR